MSIDVDFDDMNLDGSGVPQKPPLCGAIKIVHNREYSCDLPRGHSKKMDHRNVEFSPPPDVTKNAEIIGTFLRWKD